MPRPRLRSLPGLLFSCLAVLGTLSARAQERSTPEPPLPLKRVVLFSSSVGFFQHRGEIDGNQLIEFPFKTADINDLLKSVVVQDRGGGLVTTVNYGSPEPLARTLRTFAIDLTRSPTLAQIFEQLRGQKVHLETPHDVSGVIVGIETRTLPAGDKPSEVQVLNLRTDQGLRSVRLDAIQLTRFDSPEIDREFQQALELLASQHADDQKRVKFDFQGQGKRQVSVGYIQEAPVWKTSYRLVLDDDEPPFLQGWAIVENTTPHDWNEVQLTLVSGRPISFVMDLYEPLFMPRPLVVPEHHASLRPRVYEQDLASRQQEFEMAGDIVRSRSRRNEMGMGGMMGGMGGGFGGGTFGGGEPASGREQPAVTSVVPVTDGIDLAQGVATAANGGDVGELFRYVIQQPLTLGRSQSAMLPIVNEAVKGEKVAIYNPEAHAKHPLAGLRLTNTTELHLLQGPITLFDGGEYAGDARIEDIPPDSSRLISYALDLETEIAATSEPPQQVIVSLAIRKGGLFVKHQVTRKTHYTIKNSSNHEKHVLLERPIDPAWKLVEPAAAEATRSLHRLSATAQPGKTAALAVIEERDAVEEFVLAELEPAKIETYLRLPVANPKLKAALEGALQRKTAVAAAQARRAAVETALRENTAEQIRVQGNLQALPAARTNDPDLDNRNAARELVKRYLARLAELENQMEDLREQLATRRQEEQKAGETLDAFLQNIVAE